jgi:hypothetical protein
MSRRFTQSRMKCARMSMCFILECDWGSWVHATVPWLSQYKGVGKFCVYPSLWNSERSHKTWHAQCEHAMYSASQDERATTICCFELHVSGPFPHSIMNPEIDFQFSDMAQSESANALNIG